MDTSEVKGTMKISGFAMVRNAGRFYFPIRESILSILPVVDEFIVALGDNSPGDTTRAAIESIGSDKVKILDRVWSEESFVDGKIFVEETNFALDQCTGDWCFYLQADEVVHENNLAEIRIACERELHNKEVDGFLFKYYHFWGDYAHYLPFHGWYKNEIRVIRNRAGIRSFKDAQSFRKNRNEKLSVIELEARIYHYGWVRPPRLMQSKKKEQDSIHHGIEKTTEAYTLLPHEFDYGALGNLPEFPGTHPAVMKDWIAQMDWQGKLNYSRKADLKRGMAKHEKRKYRVLSWLENALNGGRDFVGYSNWRIIRK